MVPDRAIERLCIFEPKGAIQIRYYYYYYYYYYIYNGGLIECRILSIERRHFQ